MLGCVPSHPPYAISTTLCSGVHMARINLPACWILEDTQCKYKLNVYTLTKKALTRLFVFFRLPSDREPGRHSRRF